MKKILIAFTLMLTLIGTLFITTKTYAYTYDNETDTFNWNWEELEFNESNSKLNKVRFYIDFIYLGQQHHIYDNHELFNMQIKKDENNNYYVNILDMEKFRLSYTEDEGYYLQFYYQNLEWCYVNQFYITLNYNTTSYINLNYNTLYENNNYNIKYNFENNIKTINNFENGFDVIKVQDKSTTNEEIIKADKQEIENNTIKTKENILINNNNFFGNTESTPKRTKYTIDIPTSLDEIYYKDYTTYNDYINPYDTEEQAYEGFKTYIGKYNIYESNNRLNDFIKNQFVYKNWTNVDNIKELQDTIEQLQNQINVFNNGNILSQKIYFNDTLQNFNDWDYVFKANNRLLEIDSSGIRDIYDSNGNVNIRYEIELKEPFSVYDFHGKIESIEDININLIKTNDESEYYISYNSTSGENGDGYFNYGIVQDIKKIIITTQANDQRPNAYNYIDFGGNYQQGYNDGYLSAKEYYERLIAEKEEQIHELEDTIQSLEQDKIELQNRIAELEQLNSNLEIQIDNYTGSILNYMDTIEELQNEIRIKNNNIATLTSEKQALTTQYNELLERYNNITSDNNDLYSMIIAVADTPINIFKNIFNFNVLGIDVSGTIFAIISLIIIVWLIKKII